MKWKRALGLFLAGGLLITACKDPEDCTPGSGDEDKDGAADCADSECSNVAICDPSEDCNTIGDEDQNGLADCNDPACATFPACQDVCGNDLIDLGEDCDGDNLNGQDCATLSDVFVGGTLLCSNTCSFNTSQCVVANQENCNVVGDEDNDGASDCADSDCAVDPDCIESGNCGDGIDNDLDGLIDCLDAAQCATDPLCVVNLCGNGAIDAGESCDGALFDGATCSSATGNSLPLGDLSCSATCQIVTTGCSAPICNNNNTVDSGEQCDDGNTINGDGCDSCAFTPDFEQEDNDAQAASNLLSAIDVIPSGGDGQIKGFISPLGDVDFFQITLGATSDLRAETSAGPLGTPCADFNVDGVDSEIDIFDANGLLIDNDDDGGPAFCSLGLGLGLPAGDYFVAVRASDIADAASEVFDYTLSVTVTPIVCGDSIVGVGEQCDDGNLSDGDGCDSLCQREPLCGDGFIDSPEQCDDSNTAAGDGCDASCLSEPEFEIELNNTVATANVFEDIDVNVDRQIKGSLNPIGDLDFFSFDIAVPSNVKLEVFDGTGAPNCNGGIDPDLQFIDTNGTTVLVSDDLDGPNFCPKIDAVTDVNARNRQPGTYFARVSEFGNNNTIAAYTLVLTLSPIVCGDGVIIAGSEVCDDGNTNDDDGCSSACVVEQGFICSGAPSACALACGNGVLGDGAGEQCDDGNTNDGDGCSSVCQVEGVTSETDPNDSAAQADAAGLIISSDTLLAGTITDVTDEKDFYRVEVATPSVVRFETFTSLSPVFDCNATTTTLRLFQANGTTQIATDSTSGIRSCSALILALNPGVYYIQVEESGTNANVPLYFLEAIFLLDQGAETEGSGIIGVNDTSATAESALDGLSDVFSSAEHPANDRDFYVITVPPGAGIRAEVIEATNASAAADLTCNANNLDADLRLFDSDGTTQLILDDLDGRGFCPLIDGTGTTPLDAAAKNNTTSDKIFFLSVQGFTQTDVFSYRLILTVR
jgi:cysteine-rich repeat protein